MTNETKATPDAPESESSAKQRRKPKILIGLSLLLAAGSILGNVFVSELDDALSIGLDVVNSVVVICTLILIVLWAFWVALFSGWKWPLRLSVSLMLIAAPVAFFLVLRPVAGGDVNFLRFEPLWASREKPQPMIVDVSLESIDLNTKTPDDFPRFLGSDAATSIDAQLDADRFSTSKILWKQPIGLGWSGFVARNGYAVTMEQRGEHECVSCYDIDDGKLIWLYKYPARHRDVMNLGHVGPRSTPTIDNGNVYAMGAVGNFVCLDGKNGVPRWQVDMNELMGIELGEGTDTDGFSIQYEQNTSLAWGRSGSPVIVDGLVIVPGGGPDGDLRSTLLAFDCETGKLMWRGGDEMIAYGSPTLATVSGVRQILLTAESKAMGFDPKTGDVLWQVARSGQSNGGANTSQVTIVSETDVLTSKGYPDGGGERIRLNANGATLEPESVWFNARVMRTKLTSPLTFQGFAYCISNGFMECVDLADGQRAWKRRGRFGHGQILRVGDKILIHGESGTLHLIDATSEQYREYGSVKTIQGVCWNNLCLFGSRLLVRSDIEAACIELPIADVGN